jgi:hypothetical protein
LVDSLVVYKNFTTDEAGIYKFSSWIADSFPAYFDYQKGEIVNPHVAQNLCLVDDVDYIYQGFNSLVHPNTPKPFLWKMRKLFERETDSSEFATTYRQLLVQKADTGDEWHMAFMNYVAHPFNEEGLRSIAFKNYKSKRKKVLLVGDSFVYGMVAEPRYNCFADILLARGYLVYSAGIPGTDPAQYAAIAQKYIPLLKPDVVLVCFYEGNDYMPFARMPASDKPHEYITNAGLFQSSPAGVFLNAEQAYAYAKNQVLIPEQPGNKFNSGCAQTALTGLLWGALYKMKVVDDPVVAKADSILYLAKPDIEFTSGRIKLIDSVCGVAQVPLKVVVIPNSLAQRNATGTYLTIDKNMADQVMGSTGYRTPVNLIKESDFPKEDYHFNNRGSEKFADFLDSLLRQTPTR